MYIERSQYIHCLEASIRDKVYKAERIGESGEPWGVPFRMGKGDDS
jgi:hypothetical protein